MAQIDRKSQAEEQDGSGPLYRHKGLTRFLIASPLPSNIQDPFVGCRLVRGLALFLCWLSHLCHSHSPLQSLVAFFSHLRTPFPPFKAVPPLGSVIQGSRSATLILLRTRTKSPLPCARASHSYTAVVLKHVIYSLHKTPYVFFVGSLSLSTRVLVVLLSSTSYSPLVGV